MFNNNNPSKNGSFSKNGMKSSSVNLIGPNTNIKGEVRSEGDVRIDGQVTGDIHCRSKVVIGKHGKVEGNITCQQADILGQFSGGSLVVHELLSLKGTARIAGELSTKKLVVESGATFNGNCSMDAAGKPEAHDRQRKQVSAKTG